MQSLREACLARNAYASTNSLFNEVTTSIREMSIDDEASDNDGERGKVAATLNKEASEVLEELVRRSGAPLRAVSGDGVAASTHSVSTGHPSDELTESEKIDFVFGSIIGSPTKLNSPGADGEFSVDGVEVSQEQLSESDNNYFNILETALGSGVDSSSARDSNTAYHSLQQRDGNDSSQPTVEYTQEEQGEGEGYGQYDSFQPPDEYTQEEQGEGEGYGQYDSSQPPEEYTQEEQGEGEGYGQYDSSQPPEEYMQEEQGEGEGDVWSPDMDQKVEDLLGRGTGQLPAAMLSASASTSKHASRSVTPQQVPPLPLKLVLPPDNVRVQLHLIIFRLT